MPRALRLVAALGALAVAVGFLRRRLGRRRARVDVYFDDGSMVSLVESEPHAARLLEIARAAL